MFNIAVVNSSSFGKVNPQHWQILTKLGKVKRFDVPVDIPGKKLGKMVKGFHAIIAGVNPNYPVDFFKETKGTLKIIARHGIGYNNVDIQAASAAGVVVTKVPGKDEQEAMAEHVVTLMLSAMRKIDNARQAVRKGGWHDRPKFVGTEVRGRVLGVIGIGNIGRRAAEIVRKGFGAKVIAYDSRLSAAEVRRRGAEPVSLKKLLKTSDIISLNCSLTKENRHFMNASVFRSVRQGLVLVNTARGELVEQKALLAALKSGRVSAYACDVVEGEPITNTKHPLLKHPNVIVVPHIGAYTQESLFAMGVKVVQDVLDVAHGRKPKEIVRIK